MYPLLILIIINSTLLISQEIRIMFSIQPYVLFLLTGCYIAAADYYDFSHIIHVDSAEINYRTVYNIPKSFHIFNRVDFR